MKKLTTLIMAFTLAFCGSLCALASEAPFLEDEPIANIPTWVMQEEASMAAALSPSQGLPVKSAILMEQKSGRILFAVNETQKLPPASITKIMSLLLVMEAIEQGKITLQDRVACSENAASFGGSQIWLKPGEEMTVDELLKAATIASANDATVCLAEHVAGSEMAFVQMMNQKATELGMENTVFKCAAGLDNEGHLTTAQDIAIMSRELLKYPLIKNYSTVWMDSLRDGATQLVNTNRLVRFYQGATGLKTGTTSGAGSCLSATAERDGLGLIAVVMGADNSDNRFAAARALLDWGFANFTMVEITPPQDLSPLPVARGVTRQVELYTQPPEGFVVEKSKKENITQDITIEESLVAPVKKDQQVGSVSVCVEGQQVLDYPILTATAVEKMTINRAMGILIRVLLACG